MKNTISTKEHTQLNFSFLALQCNASYVAAKKLKELATSRFAHLEKLSPTLSSLLFLVRFNLLHPYPSLFLYGLSPSLWCFSILVNCYFQVSFNLKVILYVTKITQNTVMCQIHRILAARIGLLLIQITVLYIQVMQKCCAPFENPIRR